MKTFAIAALCVFGLVGGVSIYADQTSNASAVADDGNDSVTYSQEYMSTHASEFKKRALDAVQAQLNLGACWIGSSTHVTNRCNMY